MTTDVTHAPSPTDPATQKQMMLLGKLAAWRQLSDVDVPEGLTVAEASALIDSIRATPRPRRAGAEVGYYLHEGELYEVRERQAGGTYAQWWRTKDGVARWKFVPGMVIKLDGAQQISAEQADKIRKG